MRYRILAVDDEYDNRYMLEVMLQADFDVVTAEDGGSMWEKVRRGTPDLILMDIGLPGNDGFVLGMQLRDNGLTRGIPLIYVSGLGHDEDVERGFDNGAVDFIRKPFNRVELKARLFAALKRCERERELEEQALHDPLTGMYNRRYFFSFAANELLHAGRHGINLCFAMLDIDLFKRVNDEYGHQVGDVVLKRFSDHIMQNLREYDVAARYGGEEFLILIRGGSLDDTEHILDRIRDALAADEFRINGYGMNITFSAGVVSLDQFTGETATLEQLIKAADERLYIAKLCGRDRIIADNRNRAQ